VVVTDGVAPKATAVNVWTSSRSVYSIHFNMQMGCCAFDDTIHVSAHPVTPSVGVTEATGTFPSDSNRFWFTGHAVPITMSWDSNPSISSV
jgi:hypothetical protein